MNMRKPGQGGVRRKVVGWMLTGVLAIQLPIPGPWGGGSASLAAAAEHAASFKPAIVTAAAAEASATASVQPALRLVQETPVTSGAVLRRYVFSSARKNQPFTTNINMIVVDLSNPYVKLDVMTGVQGDLVKRQTVLGMTRETGAVAGTNGDYFHMQLPNTPPMGPVIDDGKWLTTPLYTDGWYTFGITRDNRPVIDFYTFEGEVIAPNGASFPLAGINRPGTWNNGVHSHMDKVFLYTPDWKALDRGNDGNTIPNEILVQNGIVTDMVFGKKLDIAEVPEDGYILRANRLAADFFRDNVQIGDRLEIRYDLKPLDSNNPVRGQDLRMLIGGHTLLVNEGKPANFTASVSGVSGNAERSRTAVGYSRDGRFVYLITADKSGDSQGLTLKELQEVMVLAGVWKGMNLDGGGSTQLVYRPLGETGTILGNSPEYGTARQVINGLGVYTTAPQGELFGLVVQGPQLVFLKERVPYTVKAYDTYYNPFDVSDQPVQWTTSDPAGVFEDNVYRAGTTGEARITASIGKTESSHTVRVVGRKDLDRLVIDTADNVFVEGKSYKLTVTAVAGGLKRTLPSEVIDWELIGLEGDIEGDMLTVRKLTDPAFSQIIARYDGFSTMLTVANGREQLWADFDRLSPPVSFIGYPEGVQGWAQVLSGLPGLAPDNHALHIRYDFLEVNTGQTKAAYAAFNNDEGVEIPGQPIQMKLRLMGDNSFNWVRAEVVDANGEMKRINISLNVNWYGFKDIIVDLTEYDLAYPIRLKRIYVASPEENQNEREQGGAIAIDDITFYYQGNIPSIEKPVVELTIDQKRMLVNGEARTLDQAPVIERGRTLIPIRFVVDALGGDVAWDPTERKVTLIHNSHLIEMWIDDPDLIVDGTKVPSDVSPKIMNGRTMVPLRIISEAFGWKVTWDEAARKVYLE